MKIVRLLLAATLFATVSAGAVASTVVDYSAVPAPGNTNFSAVTTFGSTAAVGITTRTFNNDPTLTTFSNRISYWGPGYSSLSAAVFAETDGHGAEITLTPLTGLAITLQSFQFGSYAANAQGVGPLRTASILRVVEVGTGTVLWNGAPLNVTTTQTLTPNVSSTLGLSLQWGYDWNTGVNNLTFDVGVPSTRVVPVPPALALFLGGLGFMGWASRKRV